MALSNVPSQGHASYFFSMYISMTLVVRNQYWVHKIRMVLTKEEVSGGTIVSISSGQRNLMKTYHNEANTGGITKIALKNFRTKEIELQNCKFLTFKVIFDVKN